jgi:hypothetical protein
MKCPCCGVEFEKVIDTISQDFKTFVCLNPDCDKYAQLQTLSLKEEKKP